MPWYLIIPNLFINILVGIFFCYSLLLMFFHPKKRKLLGIKLPIGLTYFLRDKLSAKISEKITNYIEVNQEEFRDSKPREIAIDLSGKIINWLDKKIFKFIPEFICEKIRKFITDVSIHFARELVCVFVPDLLERYMIKEKISDLLSDDNIRFIEKKAKYYLTKPLAIVGCILGLIFGVFNLIFLIIV